MTGSLSAQLQKICNYLLTKYKPEAILLHGSRIYDDAPETSDYDLAIITNQPEKIFPHEYEGMMLDLEGIALDTKTLQTGNQVPKWPLQILFDGPERRGKMLHDNTQAAYLKGPDPLSDQEWSNRENYTTRLINKIQSRSSNASVRHYYMSDFYTRAIRYWFEKRQICGLCQLIRRCRG